jgi:plasmid stabilization system protein ParE
MSGYAFHPDAFADLDEIWEYVAQDNVDAADRVLADIHLTFTTLAESPQIGHRRPDLTTRPLRFHVIRDEYLTAYAPAEKPLWVLAVFHAVEIRDSWRPFFAAESNRNHAVESGSRWVTRAACL